MEAILIDGAILELKKTHVLLRLVQVQVQASTLSNFATLTLDKILPKTQHGDTPKVSKTWVLCWVVLVGLELYVCVKNTFTYRRMA